MCFALISVLLATPQRAQAQTREAYVAQSEDKSTLTFYYDALRATRTGTTWGIEETKKERDYTFPAWAGTYQVADRLTAHVVFDASFRDFRPTTTARWFSYYRALKQIEGLEYLNTAEVKDMSRMFFGCSGLTSLDLSHFNTQNVTGMSYMFSGCSGLPSLDVSNFNTQKVTDMYGMFSGCSGLTSLDLSNFNTQNVTNMSEMFSSCSGLPSLDLSHFNTQNVTDMSEMFSGCSGLPSLDLSHFNTQNVTNMSWMFRGCSGLPSLDVSHFNTQNVTNMRQMFSGCSGLPSLDVSHFNTQKVTYMSEMFRDCSGLTSLDLKNFNTKKVTEMREMFSGCRALTTIHCNKSWRNGRSEKMFDGCVQLKGAVAYDVNKTDDRMDNPETGYFTRGVEAYVAQSADKTTLTFYYDALRGSRTGKTWDIEGANMEEGDTYPTWGRTGGEAHRTTTRVVFDASFREFRPTTTSRWFTYCEVLTQIEGLEYLNTSEVTNMREMFYNCSGLTSLDVSHFNTQNVTDMRRMFSGCSGLTSLDVSHFNPQNVTDMGGMFYKCSGLTSLDVSNFNTQNVTDMSWMFDGCSGLTSLDVSHFNTQNVTYMNYMFSGCSGLTSLDVSNFNTQNVTNMRKMFSGCSVLTSLDVSNFNTQNVTYMQFMFSGCSALTTINSNTAWQCPTSVNMFAGCEQLKGAVPYDENKTNFTMANPETGYFTAKPTAVESVRFGADSVQHIYTLQGKRVREAWKHLPAGVYVVNGKKTVKP